MLQEAYQQGRLISGTQFLMTGYEEETQEIEEDHETAWQFMQDHSSVQRCHGITLTSMILLDSQAAVYVFVNCHLLQDIQCASHYMHIHATRGVAWTSLIGDALRYGTVWFHLDRITYILSLSKIEDNYMVTYNSTNGNAFVVHGHTRMFKESTHTLYYYNTSLAETESDPEGRTMLEENASNYSNVDYVWAISVR